MTSNLFRIIQIIYLFLKYDVDKAGDLKISVYNILGQEVAVLYSGYQTEGNNFSVELTLIFFILRIYF